MNTEIDPELAKRLDVLKKQPHRSPQALERGRSAFLEEAQKMAISGETLSAKQKLRHSSWKNKLQTFFWNPRKERSPLLAAFGTILLVLSLAFGGGVLTVAAAQGSFPDDLLYPLKTWSENFRFEMTNQTEAQLNLALQLANRRAEEIQYMLKSGRVPPESVQLQLQAKIDYALKLAAGQNNQEVFDSLEKVRAQVQAQVQAFQQINQPADPQAGEVMRRTQTMLQTWLQLCDEGLQDPEKLRQQLRDQDRERQSNPNPVQQPSQAGLGGPKATFLPENKNSNSDLNTDQTGSNPWHTETPTPGSNYSPGPGTGGSVSTPWTNGTPTQNSGEGPGPGTGEGGSNPNTTGTPTPGSGYGPGPGDNGSGVCTCTPGTGSGGIGGESGGKP